MKIILRRSLLALFTVFFFQNSFAEISYFVEASVNDENFIINGEKYSARTFCWNVEEGDQVIFLEGNAYGACAAASFYNKRTRDVCEVWCE